MCRLAAYVGDEPRPLSTLLYDPPHSLEHAAYAPRELLRGSVNVDGTGIAWWPPGEASQVLRYVTERPPWSDPNLPGLSRALPATTMLGAVRSATPGMPFGVDSVAPFVDGTVAMVHNGWIGGFGEELASALISELPAARVGNLRVLTDSRVLATSLFARRDAHPDEPLPDAVATIIGRVAKLVSAADRRATLNVAVAEAGRVVATRTSVATDMNSLYVRSATRQAWLASEPLDDHDWQPVPDHSIVVVSADGVTVNRLDHEGAA